MYGPVEPIVDREVADKLEELLKKGGLYPHDIVLLFHSTDTVTIQIESEFEAFEIVGIQSRCSGIKIKRVEIGNYTVLRDVMVDAFALNHLVPLQLGWIAKHIAPMYMEVQVEQPLDILPQLQLTLWGYPREVSQMPAPKIPRFIPEPCLGLIKALRLLREYEIPLDGELRALMDTYASVL